MYYRKGVDKMKKNILKCVITILLLISLASNVYFFLFKANDKLILPIYEVTYSETGYIDITNEFDSLNNNKYKLVNKVECKYDVCYWYDYNVSRTDSARWIYYDNNASNEGGYYIYDQKLNKTIYGPYKNIRVDIDDFPEKMLQGVYLYSYNDKVGYFDLRGLNKMLFEVEYDSIESSQFHDYYVTKNNGNSTLYSFLSNKLVKISDDIDDYTFVNGAKRDYVTIQKNNKYNFVYEVHDVKAFETNDNYDFLSVYEAKDNNGISDLYFVYVKDGETYISRTNFFTLRDNNSLAVDPTYNHKISTKVEQWFITPTDNDEILHVYPNYQSNEYYVINLNESKIEKK
jgi:hypothetical protein